METIKSTQENEKILGDVISQQVKDKLEEKKTFAQDLIQDCQTAIAVR